MLKTKLSEAEERIKYYESQVSSNVSPERDVIAAPLISLESPGPSVSFPPSPSPTPTDPNKVLNTTLLLMY